VLVLNDPPARQLIVADPALNLKEKLKGLRTNWALRTGQGLSADDKKDELVKVSALQARARAGKVTPEFTK
jgi:hypothetical protein